jgi:putative cardiolipin synthase
MKSRPADNIRLSIVLLASLVLTACGSLRSDFVRKPSIALPPAFDTKSSQYVHAETAAHGDESGFRLLTSNTNALLSRIALADHAAHSLDLQYYIFENDATGRLVAQHLLAAADRGVRVRLLIDDINSEGKNRFLDAFDAHPNMQVRLFNPFRTRSPSLPSRIAQFVLEGPRLNRRMHNKSFIADNTVAIVGGRNIGDPYFDAASNDNFRDLDVIAIGPVVAQASHTFDDYWNSDAAYPIKAFRDTRATDADLASLRAALMRDARKFAESDYALAAIDELPHGPSADRSGSWMWGAAQLVADHPEKVEVHEDAPELRIGPQLKKIFDASTHEVLVITPYFVPGKSGTRYLGGLAQRGIDVNVLTNSLGSTDEVAAEAGYANHRRDLLVQGVHLFELRPAPGGDKQQITARGTSSGVSLHAKAVVVDRRYVFVGSMNMDPRSKLLNTEMGVIVDCPPLAEAVAKFFASASATASAYRVELQPAESASGRLVWITQQKDGRTQTLTQEPDVDWHRRLAIAVFRILPIEGLL